MGPNGRSTFVIHHYAVMPHASDTSWEFYCAWTGDWIWVERTDGEEVGRSRAFPSYGQCRRDAERHGYQWAYDTRFFPAGELTIKA